MSLSPAEALAPYKGHYVRIAAQTRRCTWFSLDPNAPAREYSPWSNAEIDGLVTSIPYLNGRRLESDNTLRILGVESLWVEPWDSITHICQECQHLHPLPKMLAEARLLTGCDSTCAKDRKCSLCGSVNTARMVVPYKYRWIGKSTSHETIEKELVSLIFQRKMTDWNASFAVLQTKRMTTTSPGRKKLLRNYESRLITKSNEIYTIYHCQPLPVDAWTRWLDYPELKTLCSEIRSNGKTVWQNEEAAR